MKIHYVVTSLETGGAEFAIPKIVQTLQYFGHEVEITACRPDDMGAAPRLEAAGLAYDILFPKRQNPVFEVWALIRRLRVSRPDVIWTSLSHGTIIGQVAGAMLGIPVVSWKNSASCRNYLRFSRHLTALWVSDSGIVGDFLRNVMQVPSECVMSWPLYCCDASLVVPSYWDGRSVLQIGTTGRLHEVKNYSHLIEGVALFCKKYPEKAGQVHLSFAGDGPQRAELEALVTKHGMEKRVSLLGFLSDPRRFLMGLHLYAQPSRYEGMCLAVHEAMAVGLPIIATPVGEMSNSLQEGKAGFFVQHDTLAEDICRALEHVFAQPECLAVYGQAARHYVMEHYSEEAYRQNCTRILKHIKERVL